MNEIEDVNVLELNCKLQEVWDNRLSAKMAELSQQEKEIHERSLYMSAMIRDLRDLAIHKNENDPVELSENMKERIAYFHEHIWHPLQKQNQGIITDDYHPFPTELNLDNLKRKHVDRMIDNLSTLLDQEQNAITHVTRKLKKEIDTSYLITEMTSYRAKQDPIKTFVRNQKT